MSEDKEKISAWLDDAIQTNELDSLEVDQDVRSFSTAARYQMIGEALRGRVSDASMVNISARVREAIEREATPVSTARTSPPARRESKPLFDFGAWLRPVGGLAVAATVAMVMVVTLTDRQAETAYTPVASSGQLPVQALPVSNTVPVYSQPNLAMPAVNLNNYLRQHSEFAAQDTLQGMMPYARSVSYGSDSTAPSNKTVNDRRILNNPHR